MSEIKTLLDSEQLQQTVEELARQLLKAIGSHESLALVGIQRKGRALAQRLKRIIDERGDCDVDLGELDITLHRDDLAQRLTHPIVHESQLHFDVNGRTIVMVDDVLHTGRSVRAALNALMNYGRTTRILLLVLADVGGRELPIQPDFCGTKLEVGPNEEVSVRLVENDGEDRVILTKKTDEGK